MEKSVTRTSSRSLMVKARQAASRPSAYLRLPPPCIVCSRCCLPPAALELRSHKPQARQPLSLRRQRCTSDPTTAIVSRPQAVSPTIFLCSFRSLGPPPAQRSKPKSMCVSPSQEFDLSFFTQSTTTVRPCLQVTVAQDFTVQYMDSYKVKAAALPNFSKLVWPVKGSPSCLATRKTAL